MTNNLLTLIDFEKERKRENLIPPAGSNSFYTIGEGEINLYTIRDNKDDYRFNLYTNSGSVSTGDGTFSISGDIKDIDNPYGDMTIITNTSLSIYKDMTVSKGTLEVHGILEIPENGSLMIRDNGKVILYSDSVLKVGNNSNINIEEGSSLSIYGKIDIHLSQVNNFLNISNMTIDSAAVMNVNGLDQLGNRIFSMTDYYTELSKVVINRYTQGSKDFPNGRLGFKWLGGDPMNGSQHIEMVTMYGISVLGDLKLSVLGKIKDDIKNFQVIEELTIEKGTTLYITESFEGNRYVRPELYLGRIINNCHLPALCKIFGTVIADGENCRITLDRGAQMYIQIGAELHLRNGAIMRSTYNDDNPVLYLDGTLIIDNIEQIDTFSKENIEIGPTGKVVILNPDTGERKLLWSTPNGIHDTDLYRLFEDRIDHVEYHISNNNGIAIDQYFEFYNRQMTKWFGDRRIEKAIHDGILVWHDGAFIELDSKIIPWVDMDCTLLHASRLFKTFGSFDKDKLQECVERLKYAGCGNILFRFIDGENVKEITLVLEDCNMENVINHPLTNMYVLTTNNDGTLFIRNNIGSVSDEKIINPESRALPIKNNKVEFPL